MGFWNEYKDAVFQVPPLPPPGSLSTPTTGGGGTTTTEAKPVATTLSGGLRADSQNSRQKDIAGLTETQIQVALEMGILRPSEVDAVKGAGYTARLQDNPWGTAENNLVKQWTANPPAFYRSTLDSSESPQQAIKNLSTVSGAPIGQGAPVSGAGGATSKTASGGGGSAGSTTRSSGGGGSVPAAAPAPAIIPNTPADFAQRGGTVVPGQPGRILLNGQQNINFNTAPTQGSDGLWYNAGSGQGFPSQRAAQLAQSYTNAGPALTSRLGNSPTAKASGQGGFSRTFAPGESNFNTIGLDKSIAAGATKGQQPGDILGTISNNTGNFLDITQGGISEGGGLTPVGNPAAPYESFTGQIPGGPSVGMSSILGNSGHDTQYWLSQMSGIPPSEIAKLQINTPEKALQFQQAVETARAQGMLPNFASLYAVNEPSGYAGAGGGSDLKWGSANGGASNTPYDQALAGFKDYALGSPDLTYFPDVTNSGNGSIQSGNSVSGNTGVDEWGNPLYFANGGQMQVNSPVAMVDMMTGRTKAIAGEAGPEKITVDPMNDVKKFGELWNSPKPKMMATGGQIAAGLGQWQPSGPELRDANGMVTSEGARLGYSSQPYSDYGGATFNRDQQVNFNAPATSLTGQPVNGSFENMDAEAKALFSKGPGQAIGAEPIGYRVVGNTRYPVYAPLNEGPDYTKNMINGQEVYLPGMPNITRTPTYTEFNNAGTPAFLQGYDYQGIPAPMGREERKARDTAFLMAALNGQDTGNLGLGGLSYTDIGDVTNRANLLNKLYQVNPEAWAQAVSSGAAGQNGNGNGNGYGGRMGPGQARDIENEAYRRRQYDIQGRNYARAGLPSPTLLDIPRDQNYTGDGEAPYLRYNREVQNGFALPFDYNVNSPWYNRDNSGMGGYGGNHGGYGYGGGWSGGDVRTPEPWGGRPMPRPGGGYGGGGGYGQHGPGDPWSGRLPSWVRGYQPVGAGA